MNWDEIGSWMLDHPKAARGIGLAIVAAGTVTYLKLLRSFTDFDHMLAVHKSDVARAASEALGG